VLTNFNPDVPNALVLNTGPFTSYLVATEFPRYVRVEAPNNLSIIDSKVQVIEAKSLNTKEPKFDKQTKEKVNND